MFIYAFVTNCHKKRKILSELYLNGSVSSKSEIKSKNAESWLNRSLSLEEGLDTYIDIVDRDESRVSYRGGRSIDPESFKRKEAVTYIFKISHYFLYMIQRGTQFLKVFSI